MYSEIGLLFQHIVNINGTETCFDINKNKPSQDTKVTDYIIVCDIIPHKKEMCRALITL